MPLPVPREGEDRNDFISRCISFEAEHSDMPHVQIVAACHSQWKRETGSKMTEGNMPDVKCALFSKPGEYNSMDSDVEGVRIWKKQILKFGHWIHPEDKNIEFEITPEVAKQVVENFKKGVPEEAPVVLTHTDNPLAKVGAIKEFEVTEDGLSVLMSVEDKEVNGNIESNEKAPGVSVWLDLNYTDKKSGKDVGAVVKHVALVNHPYIEGMEGFQAVLSEAEDGKEFLPLILSEDSLKNGDKKVPLKKEDVIKFLKEKEDIDVVTLLSEQEELKDLQSKIEKGELIPKKEEDPKNKTTLLSEELLKEIKKTLELGEDVKTAEEVIKQLLSKYTEVADLKKNVETLQGQLSEMEADKRIGLLLTEGRAFPNEKDFLKNLYKTNVKLFEQMEKTRKEGKPLIVLSETGVTDEEFKAKEKDEEVTTKRNIEAGQKEGIIEKEKE